jgi:Skp family chaperone for outer membrane proteins
MKKTIFISLLTAAFILVPFFSFSITLVRVGYVDLDVIILTYTTRYLETEISTRENYTSFLQEEYNQQYFRLDEEERADYQSKLKDHYAVLNMLRYNKVLWDSTEDIRDDIIFEIVQRDIMGAIKKTGELEGYSLVLDNTGNFIYGSEDINLTDNVLFRLDEKLLDIQNNDPLAPLALELEDNPELFSEGL